MPSRAVVVGGSLAGLNAALQLRRAGWEVQVFERRPRPLARPGTGVLLQRSAGEQLAECGISAANLTSTTCSRLRHYDASGSVRHEASGSYRFISWDALQQALLAALGEEHFHPQQSLVGIEQDETRVTARFSGGQVERADLMVCADGTRSASRRILLPASYPRYAGYVAWRGRVSEDDLPATLSSRLAGAVSVLWLPNGHVLVQPAPVPAAGPAQFDVVWYRNVPDGPALAAMFTDREGRRRSLSVPPGMVSTGTVEGMRLAAIGTMPAAFAAVVANAPEPCVEQVVDVTVPRMAVGRVCLIGNAAFTVRSHAAAALAKALEDGWALAEAVSAAAGDVVAALAEWEPARLNRGRRLVARVARRAQTGIQWPDNVDLFGVDFAPG